MAEIGKDPVPNTPADAVVALDSHLPIVLRGKTMSEVGWERPDLLTLYIPLSGQRADGKEDEYMLRLNFGYYPEWPPSAQFVNPQTKQYLYPDDVSWLPHFEGNSGIAMHTAYKNESCPQGRQLICCSMTLEFYLVRHGVDPRHLWNSKRDNFAATLNAIRGVLQQPYYKGRQAR